MTDGTGMYKKFIKRLLDVLFSLIAIIVLLIPMIIISIIIKCDSKGPAIFVQERVGLHKKCFNIYKFRTMRGDAPNDVPTNDLADSHKWITKKGAFFRRTSIDELPQLFNILKGDMSIVGPRPIIPVESDLIDAREEFGANDILPGLTGMSQISGRDDLSIHEKAQIDGDYVKLLEYGHFRGFCTDVKCIFKTISYVYRGEGIRGIGNVNNTEKENDETKV